MLATLARFVAVASLCSSLVACAAPTEVDQVSSVSAALTEGDVVAEQKAIIDAQREALDTLRSQVDVGMDRLAAYAEVESALASIDIRLGVLAESANAAGAVAWKSGADLKLSMIDMMIGLDPARAAENEDLRFETLETMHDTLSTMKLSMMSVAMHDLVSRFTACTSVGNGFEYADGTSRYLFPNAEWCASQRYENMSEAQTALLAQETAASHDWINDTLSSWLEAIQRHQSVINVVLATYGEAMDNNAILPVSMTCNGRTTCAYEITAANLGDPAPSMTKTFTVFYTCSNDRDPRGITIPVEAIGQIVQLSCAR